MGSVGKQPNWRTQPREDQSRFVLGNKKNFWIWTKEDGFDLTHPPTQESDPIKPHLKLQCKLTPILVDPAKTALLIIDLQNYDLHEALGNKNKNFYDAEDIVLKYAIPAARKAEIQIIWVTTGYSDDDLKEMDPAVFRTFNFNPVEEDPDWAKLRPGEGFSDKGEYRNQKGVGEEIGMVKLKSGEEVDAGRVLIRDSWNSLLHDPLAKSYKESQSTKKADVHFYKNRSSGMCSRMTELTEYLERNNLRTLLFTGINTDQCVMGTLQDGYLKGFDTILLKDGSATDSPEYAQMGVEFNCLRCWGFLSTCENLAKAVEDYCANAQSPKDQIEQEA
ncbi:isochorismatase family protein [Nemania sp. FL0031]|nr:isochorismatase family protein [Nemania sp. FL0031]